MPSEFQCHDTSKRGYCTCAASFDDCGCTPTSATGAATLCAFCGTDVFHRSACGDCEAYPCVCRPHLKLAEKLWSTKVAAWSLPLLTMGRPDPQVKEPLTRAALRALVASTILVLGDDAAPKSAPWWHYNFVIRALGREVVVELVGIALQGPTPATAACWLKGDGSPRTTGGAFFALARARLSRSRWNHARWLAKDCLEKSQAKAAAA